MHNTCLSLNDYNKVISFPHSNIMPVRPAEKTDIKAIIELWANSATMRYFLDPERWSWKGKASEAWADYAIDLIQNPRKFLLICDLQDNGLSGFLSARLEDLPIYYEHKYSLTIEEFYLRPKDKKLDLFKEMVRVLIEQAELRFQESGSISLKIEIPESDTATETLLIQAGLQKSSSIYTISF
jgi:hypothetical protein